MGVLLILEFLAAIHVLLAIWPDVARVPDATITSSATATATATTTTTTPSTGTPAAAPASTPAPTAQPLPTVVIFGYHWTDPSADSLYIVAVIVLAALGALIHELTSFATFLGNRRFVRSWWWWYVLRVPIGISLGLIIYFAVRGGLLSVSTSTSSISPYGVGTVAALAGMFSKQATDKLREVFETLMPTSGDAERDDKVDDSEWSIDHLVPDSLPVGATELAVQVVGSGFADDMTADVEGVTRSLTVTDATTASVELLATDVSVPGVVALRFVATKDASPIVANLRVRPNITLVAYGTEADGTPTITVTGTGFTDDSVVNVGTDTRVVLERTETTIKVNAEAGDAALGQSSVRVVNPEAAGGSSTAPA